MASRLKATGLPTFRNGVHPPENKDLTSGIPSRRLPFPDEIILPLSQHIGRPAEALVKPGDRIERGDVIAAASGYVSSYVHATAAGTVKSIEHWPQGNPDSDDTITFRSRALDETEVALGIVDSVIKSLKAHALRQQYLLKQWTLLRNTVIQPQFIQGSLPRWNHAPFTAFITAN